MSQSMTTITGSDLYLRFSVGHKGKFGNELLKFELLSTGELTYCNNSNYKMERSIERNCKLTPILLQHISYLITNSGILQQSDANWPPPDQVGREEIEIIIGNRHVTFTTTKLGSLAEALNSKDPKGLEIFYYSFGPDFLSLQDESVLKLTLVALSSGSSIQRVSVCVGACLSLI